ncbi:Uncharacterised protein [Bordetella pertussis]|nr:Uncharacterised protein [Bordetella pertussis]CFP66927.1 Uncharacterised protein [Bordetella pertussis]
MVVQIDQILGPLRACRRRKKRLAVGKPFSLRSRNAYSRSPPKIPNSISRLEKTL